MLKFYVASFQSKENFVRLSRKPNAGGDGVDFFLGYRPDGSSTVESILFDSAKFSRQQIEQWLSTHRSGEQYDLTREATDLKGLSFDQVGRLVRQAINQQYPPIPQEDEEPYEGACRYHLYRLWDSQALASRGYWSDSIDPRYLLFTYSIEASENGSYSAKLSEGVPMKLQAVAVNDPRQAISLEEADGQSVDFQEAGRRNSKVDATRLNQLLRLAASLMNATDLDPETDAAISGLTKKPKMTAKKSESLAPRDGEDPGILESWTQMEGETFGESFSAVIGEGSAFDETAMVVSNVWVLGPVSKNQRRYPVEVQKEALPLFEGAKAYLNHPTSRDLGEPRLVQDLIGEHKNLRVVGDRTYSDLHLLDNATTREHLVPIVKQKPHLIGNSIVVRGTSERGKDGWAEVKKILAVRSIDVVAEPATTNGLYESQQMESESEGSMEWKDVTLEGLLEKRPDLIKTIKVDGEKEREETSKVATLEAQITNLTKELGESRAAIAASEAEKKAAERRLLVEGLLTSAKIPDVAKYEVIEGVRQIRVGLKELLGACTDEAAMKTAVATLESSFAGISVPGRTSPAVSAEQKITEGAGGFNLNHVALLNQLV